MDDLTALHLDAELKQLLLKARNQILESNTVERIDEVLNQLIAETRYKTGQAYSEAVSAFKNDTTRAIEQLNKKIDVVFNEQLQNEIHKAWIRGIFTASTFMNSNEIPEPFIQFIEREVSLFNDANG